MKVLSILGSPIRNGNTATLLHMYQKGLMEGNPDSEITEIFLQEKTIQGCSGCMSCDLGKIKHCAIKDDMADLYDLFEEANILVFATPIYFFSMTAQLKTFIDRLYAVPFEKWRGKKIVLLMTYGGDDEEDSGAVNLVSIMQYLADYTKTELAQVYGVSTISTIYRNWLKFIVTPFDPDINLTLLYCIQPVKLYNHLAIWIFDRPLLQNYMAKDHFSMVFSKLG